MRKRIALLAALTTLAVPASAHAGFSGVDTLDYGVRTTPIASAPGPDSVFAADLSGDQGVPPTASTAVGDVVAVLAPSGQLSVDMSVAGMGSLANGAHVHGPAAPGTT